MKYIFDFDDVLFYTTRHRKEHLLPLLIKAGVSEEAMMKYYQKTRLEGFSLRAMITHFLSDGNTDQEKLYEEIMGESKNFINTKLIEVVKKLGKENCFLITHGGKEFQKDKIKRAGIAPLFSEIIILIGSKKKVVEAICEKYKYKEVIFVDDKPKYFNDLDYEKYQNLKTILYTGQDLSRLTNSVL